VAADGATPLAEVGIPLLRGVQALVVGIVATDIAAETQLS